MIHDTQRKHTPLAFQISDAAEVAGISRTTIYNLMKAKKLHSVKIGGRRLIPASALHELIERGEQCTN